MDYVPLKLLHMGLAGLSLAGFILRWSWMMAGSDLARHRATRILPHLFDTLFLATGIWLAMMLGLNTMHHPWLAAKIGGLVAYIVLASLAYKRAPTQAARGVCFLLALTTFAWVVSVARLKSAWGFFDPLFA